MECNKQVEHGSRTFNARSEAFYSNNRLERQRRGCSTKLIAHQGGFLHLDLNKIRVNFMQLFPLYTLGGGDEGGGNVDVSVDM